MTNFRLKNKVISIYCATFVINGIFVLVMCSFLDRVYCSERRDFKYNQGQLWKSPKHRTHAEDSGEVAFFQWQSISNQYSKGKIGTQYIVLTF